MPTEEVRVTKDMGLSHDDFFRVLPRLLAGTPHEIAGNRVLIASDGRSLEILLGEEAVRPLGPTVRIPMTRVELIFRGYSAEARAAFLAGFDREYFRGGG